MARLPRVLSRLHRSAQHHPIAVEILVVMLVLTNCGPLPSAGPENPGEVERSTQALSANQIIQLRNQIGQLTSVSNGVSTSFFSYDARGRKVHEQLNLSGSQFISQTSFDSLDRVVQVVEPLVSGAREIITHVYGAGGGLTGVGSSLSGTLVGSLLRDAQGRTQAKTFGNGVQSTYTYDTGSTQRLRNITSRYRATIHQNLDYSFDADGNIVRLNDNVRGIYLCHPTDLSVSCSYDSLHRLTSSYAGTYAYDAVGNLTSMEGSTLAYGDSAHAHALSGGLGLTYAYDANGNQTSRSDGRTITWDAANRPTVISTGATTVAQYFYGAGGARLHKIEGASETFYVGNMEIRNGAVSRYYVAGHDRVAERDPTGALFFHHPDHIQSSNVVTDAHGALVKVTAFKPFGGLRTEVGSKPLTHRFTDKELDASGYYDYGGRQYLPDLGRFLSPDPVQVDVKNPQSLNRYAYVLNNPLRYNDPTGHFVFLAFLLAAFVGIGTAGVISATTALLIFTGTQALIAGLSQAGIIPAKVALVINIAGAFVSGYYRGIFNLHGIASIGRHTLASAIGAGLVSASLASLQAFGKWAGRLGGLLALAGNSAYLYPLTSGGGMILDAEEHQDGAKGAQSENEFAKKFIEYLKENGLGTLRDQTVEKLQDYFKTESRRMFGTIRNEQQFKSFLKIEGEEALHYAHFLKRFGLALGIALDTGEVAYDFWKKNYREGLAAAGGAVLGGIIIAAGCSTGILCAVAVGAGAYVGKKGIGWIWDHQLAH